MPDPTPPTLTPAMPPAPPTAAADPSAWGFWLAAGWVVLLAAAAIALVAGPAALGEALDVGRWFR